MRKIKPIGDRICITPLYDEKSPGGIIIPETADARKQPRRGVIVGIGDEAKIDVEIGEEVLFDKYGATGFVEEGEKFIVVNVDSVLGVFE